MARVDLDLTVDLEELEYALGSTLIEGTLMQLTVNLTAYMETSSISKVIDTLPHRERQEMDGE